MKGKFKTTDTSIGELAAVSSKIGKVKEEKYLPFIPFRLLEQGQRVPVDRLDAELENELSTKYRKSVEKYRYKKGSGIPGVNDIEIWVIGENLYYLKEWDEYIQISLEIEENATYF